jgi:hypothetical protein
MSKDGPITKKRRAQTLEESVPTQRRRVEGLPITLDNLCQLWEESPADFERPPIFFTVGHIAVLSSLSGAPESSSLCRQFWNWLGQTANSYDPIKIAFTMVEGKGIYLAAPNLTCFTLQLKHPVPLESVITLHPKMQGETQKLTAQTIMTKEYPSTVFRKCTWVGHPVDVLVDIEAEIKDEGDPEPHLYIESFYSKASHQDSNQGVSCGSVLERGLEEEKMVRGRGSLLLCLMLDSMAWTGMVTLDAAGLSYRDYVHFKDLAHTMQVGDMIKDLEHNIIQELKDLNPNFLAQWQIENKSFIDDALQQTRMTAPALAYLRAIWMRIRGTQNVVQYYMRNFGFKPLSYTNLTFVPMQASADTIRRHCRMRT